MITFEDFSRLDLRIGKVLEVSDHPNAQKLYVLKVDIGEAQIQLVAGVKNCYTPQELTGKTIVVLTNLEPKTIRGVESQGMLLVAKSGEVLRALTCDGEALPGSVVG